MASDSPDGIGREFMRLTSHAHLGPSDQTRGLPPPPVLHALAPRAERIDLPPPASLDLKAVDFRRLATQRTSVRQYAATPLSLAELSVLLWCTQGIKEAGQVHTLRTVPSAGARHPFETVLLLNRVEGVEPGLYAYEALDHQLALLLTGPHLVQRLVRACFGQGFVGTSAATFCWVAIPYRTTWRYGERGYRYMHLDAGHVCQNLYLAAETMGCGACGIAAFDDGALIDILGLDPDEAFVIYLAALGKRLR